MDCLWTGAIKAIIMKEHIAILGTGKMGGSIAKGLLSKNIISSQNLILTRSAVTHLQDFRKSGVYLTSNNPKAVKNSNVIILAVKPQTMEQLLYEIAPMIKKDQLIMSIAAGVTIENIEEKIGHDKAIVRVMPNLCAQIGESASAWVANRNVSKPQKLIVKTILNAIGIEVYLQNQNLLDAVTAISGSGPAYFFLISHLLEKAALEMGLSAEISKKLIKQTFFGSAQLLKSTSMSMENLVTAVASRGGATEAALAEFYKKGLDKTFLEGVHVAQKRTTQLKI